MDLSQSFLSAHEITDRENGDANPCLGWDSNLPATSWEIKRKQF